ncbi:MAG TPA: hypothetical protein VFH03_24945 [Actinoplanes sp.]|nr:hypothetical protein [Actinoplanes sp.]
MPFFINMIRRFVIAAVVVPLVIAGVRKASDMVDARRGPNRATRLVRRGADTAESLFGRKKRRR